jgi:hypothetical protein
MITNYFKKKYLPSFEKYFEKNGEKLNSTIFPKLKISLFSPLNILL